MNDFLDEKKIEKRNKIIRKIGTFICAGLALFFLILTVINTYTGVVEYNAYVNSIGARGNDIMDVYYSFSMVCLLSISGIIFACAAVVFKGNKPISIVCYAMVVILILCPTILYAIR